MLNDLDTGELGTGLMLIGHDGRSASTVNRISRFVFALPTNAWSAPRGPDSLRLVGGGGGGLGGLGGGGFGGFGASMGTTHSRRET